MIMKRLASLLVAALVTACSAPYLQPGVPAALARLLGSKVHASGNRIQHIVLIVQENRSFDNLFATYPGADGATSGKIHTGKTIALKMRNLAGAYDINHDWKTFSLEYDRTKMDGFDLCKIAGQTIERGTHPISTSTRRRSSLTGCSLSNTYWQITCSKHKAAEVSLRIRISSPVRPRSMRRRASSTIRPSGPFGDATLQTIPRKPTVTSLMDYNQDFLYNQGPFPCFTYPTGTLADLLDKKGVSWKYYAPPYTRRNPTPARCGTPLRQSTPSGMDPIGRTFRRLKRTFSMTFQRDNSLRFRGSSRSTRLRPS